ncbi:hypothetical protein PG997_010982 [Apiospora hydei]|uniref:Uncharacterized protein n=1 Tax=Apiospora hydei TaxID=1337664 RepID=A0ABR1VHT6_9PEZI
MQSFDLNQPAPPLLALATIVAPAPVPANHAARQLVVPNITVPVPAIDVVGVERFVDNLQQSLLETIPTNTTGAAGQVAINDATFALGDLRVPKNSGLLRNAVLEAVNDEVREGEVQVVQIMATITIPVVAQNHSE